MALLTLHNGYIGAHFTMVLVYGVAAGLFVWQSTIGGRRAYYFTQDYYTSSTSLSVLLYAQVSPILIFGIAFVALFLSEVAQFAKLVAGRHEQASYEATVVECANWRSWSNVLVQLLVAWAIAQMIVAQQAGTQVAVWFFAILAYGMQAWVKHAHGTLTKRELVAAVAVGAVSFLGLFCVMVTSAVSANTGLSDTSNLLSKISFGFFFVWGAVQAWMSYAEHRSAQEAVKKTDQGPPIGKAYQWGYIWLFTDLAAMLALSLMGLFAVIE